MKHISAAQWELLQLVSRQSPSSLQRNIVAEISDLIDEVSYLEAKTARLEAELRSARETIKNLQPFKDACV